MEEVLFNLALIDTMNFCKTYNIDCSGSHLIKNGRGFKYSLIKDETSKPIVSVVFSKNSIPEHILTKEV